MMHLFILSMSSWYILAVLFLLPFLFFGYGVFSGVAILAVLIACLPDITTALPFATIGLAAGAVILLFFLSGVMADEVSDTGQAHRSYRVLGGIAGCAIAFDPKSIEIFTRLGFGSQRPLHDIASSVALSLISGVTAVAFIFGLAIFVYELPFVAAWNAINRRLITNNPSCDFDHSTSAVFLKSVRPLFVFWLTVVLFDEFSVWMVSLVGGALGGTPI
jgi:hypothetical protein